VPGIVQMEAEPANVDEAARRLAEARRQWME
jgi:hypothetical protein